MDFNRFVDEVRGGIKFFLPREYENAEVRVEENQKINQRYLGLTVIKDDAVLAPTINLNRAFESYQLQPWVSMEQVLRKMAEAIQDAPEQFNLNGITNYENARKKLFIRVSSAETNMDMLQNVPHQLMEDLAITYHILINMNDDGLSTTTVTNEMMKNYGITKEQLHADAMENSPGIMPPQIAPMGSIMEQLLGIDTRNAEMEAPAVDIMEVPTQCMLEENPMVVVTNNQIVEGASVIFYPGIMDKIGEAFEGNLFILPSSVHETIVLPDNGDFDHRMLKDMVQEINANEVRPEEQLTNEVYHYDAKEHVFEKAERFSERQKEKAAKLTRGEKAGKEQNQIAPKAKKHDLEL